MLRSLLSDPIQLLISLPAIILSLSFHEFAHAYSAVKLGDNTPAITGRLSLNPLAHLDIIGFICMLLTGFGWAKPVQINPRNFNKRKRDVAITAAAGPISNILLSFVCVFIMALLEKFGIRYLYVGSMSGVPFKTALLTIISSIIRDMSKLNLYLAVFNLIPVPPLDGSRLVDALLPGKISYYYNAYGRYFQIGLFVILILVSNLGLFNPLSWVAQNVWEFFADICFGIFGL